MTGQVAVREVAITDAPAVAHLLGTLGYPATAAQVRRRLASRPEDAAVWVASVDEPSVVVGVAAVRTSWRLESEDPAAHLVALVTGEGTRGRGVGTVLLQTAETWARDRGAEQLTLTSGLHRSEAHRWYVRRGFEHTGVRLAKRLISP